MKATFTLCLIALVAVGHHPSMGSSASNTDGVYQLGQLAQVKGWSSQDISIYQSEEFAINGHPALHLRIAIDHELPVASPLGWPKAVKEIRIPKGLSISEYDHIEFYALSQLAPSKVVRRVKPANLAIGAKFAFQGTDEVTAVSITFDKPNTWKKFSIPVSTLKYPDKLKSLMFYQSERRYTHGDTLDFFFSDFRLVHKDAGISGNAVLLTPVLSSESPLLCLEVGSDLQTPHSLAYVVVRRSSHVIHRQAITGEPQDKIVIDVAPLKLKPGEYEVAIENNVGAGVTPIGSFRWLDNAVVPEDIANKSDGNIERQTYKVLPRTSAIRIDGRLNESAWDDALTFDNFRMIDGTQGEEIPDTQAMITYDDDAIFIAYMCREPLMSMIQSNVTEHDGPTWKDDCVEIFLDPRGDRTSYGHITVNAAGVVRDGWCNIDTKEDITWDSHAEVRTTHGDDAWIVEMRIPLKQFTLVGLRSTWAFQLARSRRPQIQHLTMLKNPMISYHQVGLYENMAGFEFAGRPLRVEDASLGEMLIGENLANMVLNNQSDVTEVATVIIANNQGQVLCTQDITIPPHTTQKHQVPWTLTGQMGDDSRLALIVMHGRRLVAKIEKQVGAAQPPLRLAEQSAYIYQRQDYVRIPVEIQLATESRSDAVLTWTLDQRDGSAGFKGQVSVDASAAELPLKVSESGQYQLTVELRWAGDKQYQLNKDIYLIEGPFVQ